VVVSAPGTDDGMRKALLDTLGKAGATVSGDVRLQSTLVDPKQDAFLATLADRVAVPGRSTPAGATGAERAAAQLADVLGVRPSVRPVPSAAAATVLSAYANGRLLPAPGGTSTVRPGSLALLLVGPPAAPGTDAAIVQAQQTLLLALARELDRSAVGAVVAGPAEAAHGGLLAAATRDRSLSHAVSTVRAADLPGGEIAAVLALAEQARGESGDYGPGSSSPLPSPSPSP
jgi:hypothetical protein